MSAKVSASSAGADLFVAPALTPPKTSAYRTFGVGLGRVFRLAINVLSGLKFDGFNFAGGHDVLVLLRLSPGIEPKGRGPSWVPGAWL